ncbi:MAG: hypothetical protein L3J20_13660 [Flavobacteriaceae bacterium]|nr:hypothetical protein [Flavobacteriaceae bacterium]
MLGYASTVNKEVLNNSFSKIHYLIGDFNVAVYSSMLSSGWIKTGEGTASYRFENTFITEKINLVKENSIITMDNTIGYDLEKNTFKLFTLDIGLGNMNVFKGTILDGILTFCSIDSGLKNRDEYDDSLCFKLIYKQLSEFENELVVGYSKDNGKTWFPFLKNNYKRK